MKGDRFREPLSELSKARGNLPSPEREYADLRAQRADEMKRKRKKVVRRARRRGP